MIMLNPFAYYLVPPLLITSMSKSSVFSARDLQQVLQARQWDLQGLPRKKGLCREEVRCWADGG